VRRAKAGVNAVGGVDRINQTLRRAVACHGA
jgi:hypothetical protein